MDTGSNVEDRKFLHDSYLEWCAGEGIPVAEGFGVHMPEVELGRWARYDAYGAFVHLRGRGDWLSVILVEIPAAAKTSPQQHLFEEVVYVLSGHGSTTIETASGKKRSFEWGQGSLFALPLNARYQHFNGSGRAPARLASTTNLPMMMNVFHNERFIFDHPFRFPEREGGDDCFAGEGTFIPKQPGRHMWETNFVPDLAKFELQRWDARGAGGSNIMFVLADGAMHAHMSEMPVGTYKKGHRHGADFHVMCVTGQGYSLFWYEGDKDFTRIDWKHGTIFAPTDMIFHQHFNTSPFPARYLATACGGLRYPVMEEKRRIFLGMDVDVKKGGAQIEYEDQDPRVHRLFLDEIRKTGATSGMGRFIDESRYA